MARGIETRLRKLEGKAGPSGGPWFVAWARDDDEVARLAEQLRAAGMLSPGDVWHVLPWPYQDRDSPALRYTRELEDEELQAILAEVQAEIAARGLPDEPAGYVRERDRCRRMSEPELMATLLTPFRLVWQPTQH